jgi:hypothetical protein
VRYGQCQPHGAVLPTPVRLTHRALEGGPAALSNPSPVNLQGQTMTSCRRESHPRHCWSCAAAPVPAAPHRALLQQLRCCWARGDGTPPRPPLYPRTDHRQRLPRARLKTPRPTTTPSPSKPPLFEYRARHDDKTVARTARTAANSAALHAILPHVAKQCGMLVIHPLLGL